MSDEIKALVDSRWAEYGLNGAPGRRGRTAAVIAAVATSLTEAV